MFNIGLALTWGLLLQGDTCNSNVHCDVKSVTLSFMHDINMYLRKQLTVVIYFVAKYKLLLISTKKKSLTFFFYFMKVMDLIVFSFTLK